jgi:hypothetical protein
MNKFTLGLYFHLCNASSSIRQSANTSGKLSVQWQLTATGLRGFNTCTSRSRAALCLVCLPASEPDCSFCKAEGSAPSAVVFCVKVSDKEQKTAADRAVSCRSIAARTKHVRCSSFRQHALQDRHTSHNLH